MLEIAYCTQVWNLLLPTFLSMGRNRVTRCWAYARQFLFDLCVELCVWHVCDANCFLCAIFRFPADYALYAQMRTRIKQNMLLFGGWQAIFVVVQHRELTDHHETKRSLHFFSRERWCCCPVKVHPATYLRTTVSACRQALAALLQKRFRHQVSRERRRAGCRDDVCTQLSQQVGLRHNLRYYAPDTNIQE